MSPHSDHSAKLPPEDDLEKGSSDEELQRAESNEAHERQLYEGYPDYHIEPTLSKARTRTGYDDGRSTFSRIRSRPAATRSNFTHSLTRAKTSADVLVDFDGPEDPYRPINWTFKKKAYTTVVYGLTTAGATWGSSIYASAITDVSKEFHVAEVVSALGLTLYLFGFGLGPMIWAPLSELYGRRLAVFVPYFIGAVFSFGSATAKDFQTLMITRFFTGFFSSAPVTNTGGVLGDLWTPAQRGNALAGYSIAVAGGPLLAPIAGGAIIDSYLSWRWVEYITGILQLLALVIGVLTVDECYGPVLLIYKARRLRHESGNWALHAKHEEWDVSLYELAHKYLVRPYQILFSPITACMAVYASFVYGILYLCFASVPIEFEEERGWNHLVGSLPFIGTLLGTFAGAAVNSLNTKHYIARCEKNKNRPVPEARLPPMMFGAIVFPAGCFIFGWTSSADIFWLCPVIGLFLLGAGFVIIFQCALNYLIDTFQMYAASAVAGNTALRSLFAGVFPLFAPFMFHAMGIPWASSVIGFVAVAMIPIPFLFHIYGPWLRRRGKWSRPSCTRG